MIEDENAQVTLSTLHGPITLHAYQIGPLAVHPMLADDLPLRPDPGNGYGVTLAANGRRLSYNGATFRGMAHAVAFIRALVAERQDWDRWFETAKPPTDLQAVFKRHHDAAEARRELSVYSIWPAG